MGLGNVDNTSDATKQAATLSAATKSDVGLANVDNTSDANKPVSSATQTALDAKAPTASPTFTGTVSGVTKAHVGLGNVTNDTQVPASGGTFSGNITVPTPTASGHAATKAYVDSNSGGGGSYSNSDVDSHLNQSNPSSGYVLSWNGSDYAWVAQTGGGIASVQADTSPQLGGNLDVNGQDIVTTSNGDIDLDPNGSGKVVFKGNSTKGSGQFVLNCENNSHGITVKGPPHSASASYTLTLPNTDGNSGQVLKTDGSGNLDWVAQTTAYTNSDVDSHLNQSNPTNGHVLSWNGSDYAWVAQSGGGGGSYANSDVDTHLNRSSASANEILSWNGSDYAWVEQSGTATGVDVAEDNFVVGTSSTGSGGSYTNSTTVFPVSSNSGDLVSVWRNGIKIVPTTDFSVSAGSNTVTLVNAANTGDEISIQVIGVEIDAPTISSITYPTQNGVQATALAATGAQDTTNENLLISGSNFTSVVTVSISGNGLSASAFCATTSVNSGLTEVTCTNVTKRAVGNNYTLTVTNSGGGEATTTVDFSGDPSFTTAAGSLGTVYTGASTTKTIAATSSVYWYEGSPAMPSWMTHFADGDAGSSKNLTGTPTLSSGTSETQSFNIIIRDSENQSHNRDFSLIVADPPSGGTDYVGSGSPGTYTIGGVTYKVHIFLSGTTTFRVYGATTMDIFMVAGGGGGGCLLSGGGGAGGVLSYTNHSVAANVSGYTVTVGAGGAGSSSTSSKGSTGGNTSVNISGLNIAYGGGGGGSDDSGTGEGAPGGSGGGSAGRDTGVGGTGAYPGSASTDTTPRQGYDGGTGDTGGGGGNFPAGGGGGYGAAGESTTGNTSQNGGDGGAGGQVSWVTPQAMGISGTRNGVANTDPFYWAGGGGGSGHSDTTYGGGNGGIGGGGGGSTYSGPIGTAATTGAFNLGNDSQNTGNGSYANGGDGGANTGGGGGGGGSGGRSGGDGGSGIVIIRYAI